MAGKRVRRRHKHSSASTGPTKGCVVFEGSYSCPSEGFQNVVMIGVGGWRIVRPGPSATGWPVKETSRRSAFNVTQNGCPQYQQDRGSRGPSRRASFVNKGICPFSPRAYGNVRRILPLRRAGKPDWGVQSVTRFAQNRCISCLEQPTSVPVPHRNAPHFAAANCRRVVDSVADHHDLWPSGREGFGMPRPYPRASSSEPMVDAKPFCDLEKGWSAVLSPVSMTVLKIPSVSTAPPPLPGIGAQVHHAGQ